jgi:biopolymer transport protein TolR
MQSGGGSGSGGSGAAAMYRGLRSQRSSPMLGEINVTPLVDVVLVLLLVFMVTAPMMSRGVDVSLPVANLPKVEPQERLTISINAQGRIYVNDQVVNMVLLEDAVRSRIDQQTTKVAYLRADEALRYGKVIEVVDKLKKAGVEQIGFVYILPGEKAAK